MSNALRIVFALALTAAIGGSAAAFPTGEQFDGDPLATDGGGGIAFNGAPRWSGHACDVCHTNPPGQIGIRLEADQTSLFSTGWKPSTQYHLRVVLENEHEDLAGAALGDNCGFAVDPYVACDYNGFSIELDTDAGSPAGSLAPVLGSNCLTGSDVPSDVDTYVLADGTAAVHNGAHMAQTQWDLCWTSPASGAGTITAYIATVDGNGGNGTPDFPNDTTGDDVAVGAVPLAEAGAEPPPTQTGGCDGSGSSSGAVALGVLALAWLARRPGRRRTLAACLALTATAACTHVHATQRETLAHRNMKFSPDAAEDELDLHMQESREGSEGGYGTSGGGCGCN